MHSRTPLQLFLGTALESLRGSLRVETEILVKAV